MADETILVGGGGENYAEPRELLLHYANRHGLITGATGTGKTVTLQVLAEGLSAAGVPVVIQDVKGDVSGLSRPGDPAGKANDALTKRAAQIGFTDFAYRAYPVVFWDLFGQQGHPVRTTVSELGPLLLARMMELSDAQEGVLNIAFRVADEQGLLLLDLADLQSILTWLADNARDISKTYGNVTTASVGAIQRALLVLENQGAARLPRRARPRPHATSSPPTPTARGRVNVLMSDKLMQSPRLYAMFLLWLLSELFEQLPEVGDPDKPVLVFFFDEAHLLFTDAPKALTDKVVQVVRLIRSKGVGVYFCTQNPDDVPGDVLAQLGNRVQHALRAFTPRDAKALKQAAETFRPNPAFDTETAIREVGTGEAVVSLLEAKGVPAMVSRTLIRPPEVPHGPRHRRPSATKPSPPPPSAANTTPPSTASPPTSSSPNAPTPPRPRPRWPRTCSPRPPPARTTSPAPAATSPRSARRARPRNRRSAAEITRTVVKQLGTRQGQRLVRGILGSLFKGR